MKTINHFAAALAVTLVAGAVFAAQAQTPPAAGITVNGGSFSGNAEAREATAADVGLPVYPGAVPQRDKPDEGASAKLGLNWTINGTAFGFRLVLLKFTSSERLADVAAWYRNELARYGQVLDCSAAPASRNEPPAAASDKHTLRCGNDGRTPGEVLYKVGTKQQSHMVSLQPLPGGGVRFQLVRLMLPSD